MCSDPSVWKTMSRLTRDLELNMLCCILLRMSNIFVNIWHIQLVKCSLVVLLSQGRRNPEATFASNFLKRIKSPKCDICVSVVGDINKWQNSWNSLVFFGGSGLKLQVLTCFLGWQIYSRITLNLVLVLSEFLYSRVTLVPWEYVHQMCTPLWVFASLKWETFYSKCIQAISHVFTR